jgi:lipopolysaccharide/colanic/teichoic acid biosynthesis glycosyltransferase
VLIALIGLVLLSPLVFLVLCLFLHEGRPIFFLQERLGKDGKPYTIIKFRTMSADPDLKSSISPIGRILRLSGIDELPQLINVFRGEMSIVGPRALPVRYLPFFTEEERERLKVKPGITGLAQIQGRRISWNEKFKLDLDYVRSVSTLRDLKIVALTPVALIKEFKFRSRPAKEVPLDEERGMPQGGK